MQMGTRSGELHLAHWQIDLIDGKQRLDSFMKMMSLPWWLGMYPFVLPHCSKGIKANRFFLNIKFFQAVAFAENMLKGFA